MRKNGCYNSNNSTYYFTKSLNRHRNKETQRILSTVNINAWTLRLVSKRQLALESD